MKNRNLVTLLLALSGLVVSLYLLSVHWGWWQAACLGVGDCEFVNTSRYSDMLGVPITLLGALAYLSIGVSALCVLHGSWVASAVRVQFFLAVMGIAFSAYLTAIELFVLHAVCPWCVASALLITLIGIVGFWSVREASVSGDKLDPVYTPELFRGEEVA